MPSRNTSSRASATAVAEACLALSARVFDLVLLDLNLHGESGIAVVRAARCVASPPVVFVITGDPNYMDLEELEELGTKVMMKVNIGGDLAGMVRAVLDEQRAGTLPPRSGATTRAKGSVRKTRDVAPLSARERVFLERLKEGEVLSIEAIAREILGRGSGNVGNSNTAQKFVSRLRAKLEELGDEDRVIECIYGGGYRSSRTRVSRNRR